MPPHPLVAPDIVRVAHCRLLAYEWLGLNGTRPIELLALPLTPTEICLCFIKSLRSELLFRRG